MPNLLCGSVEVEVGDPQRFHARFIQFALLGVENVLCSLKMVARQPQDPGFEPTLCTQSFWMFTRTGGILTLLPEIGTWVRHGEVVARVQNVFGDTVEEYASPADGIVVGRSVNPVCSTGDRILHLGVVTAEFASVSQDGHL
jgi:predicted deacylase